MQFSVNNTAPFNGAVFAKIRAFEYGAPTPRDAHPPDDAPAHRDAPARFRVQAPHGVRDVHGAPCARDAPGAGLFPVALDFLVS